MAPASSTLLFLQSFLRQTLVVCSIVLVGWLFARLVRFLLATFLTAIQLEQFSDRIGLTRILVAGQIFDEMPDLIANMVYWLLMIIVLAMVFTVAGFNDTADLLQRVVNFIPKVFAMIFIIFVARFIALTVKRTAALAGQKRNTHQLRQIDSFIDLAITLFAGLMIFEQFGLSTQIIRMIIVILIASLGIALALAFGLGARDIVSEKTKDYLNVKSRG